MGRNTPASNEGAAGFHSDLSWTLPLPRERVKYFDPQKTCLRPSKLCERRAGAVADFGRPRGGGARDNGKLHNFSAKRSSSHVSVAHRCLWAPKAGVDRNEDRQRTAVTQCHCNPVSGARIAVSHWQTVGGEEGSIPGGSASAQQGHPGVGPQFAGKKSPASPNPLQQEQQGKKTRS